MRHKRRPFVYIRIKVTDELTATPTSRSKVQRCVHLCIDDDALQSTEQKGRTGMIDAVEECPAHTLNQDT